MTNEVRETAELFRVFDDEEHHEPMESIPKFIDAGKKLADAWIAENPADDDEPVSEEWRRSVGFEQTECVVLVLRLDFIEWYGPKQSINVGSMIMKGLPNCRTRGALRRLASALGIPLKEQART